MKWNNKGHQFDNSYENMTKKNAYYLFGAGDYGRLVANELKNEVTIFGYLDNNKEKQEKGYNGYRVFPLDKLNELKQDEGVIVSISQFSRASARAQLMKYNLVEHKNYFMFEEFLSVYHVYKYDKVFMSTISFLPSTACNLKCKHCLNFNPYAHKFYVREYDKLIKDIDLFFNKIDRVMIFHLSGGEPMMFPRIADIITYIDNNYGDRIGIFRTVTNGTVVPNDNVLETMSKCNVELTVDDYREAVPKYNDNFDILITKLNEFKVNYVINKADAWVNLAPDTTDYSQMPDEWLVKHFDDCCQTWHELREGKLYMCNYASYAKVAGLCDSLEEETYDLSRSDENMKKELLEFRLGYSEKGYTNFCKKCRGFTVENSEEVEPAAQVERRFVYEEQ